MQIGVLGGTGPEGSSLSVRLAAVGFDVVIGSRSSDRAAEVRDRLLEQWQGRGLAIEGADNATAAEADVVVLATPWDSAPSTAASVAGALDGKVVVTISNAIARVAGELQPLVPPRGSVAATVQAAVPRALVAATLHHVPARELGDIDHPVEGDVLVCSDHPSATEQVARIVDRVPGLRALDAGSLASATAVEAFTAVILQLNVRYKTRAGVRFTGIDG